MSFDEALESSNSETTDVKVIPSTDNLQCYYCSEMFLKEYIFQHMEEVHNVSGCSLKHRGRGKMYGVERPYKCDRCNYSLLQDKSRSTHNCVKTRKNTLATSASKDLPVVASAEVQCYYCSEMFLKTRVVKHIKKVHGNKHVSGRGSSKMYGEIRPYKCHMCNSSLLQEISKSKHICFTPNFEKPTVHADSISKFQCSQCNKSFYGQSGYNYHCATAHNDERAFKCDKCGYTAQTGMMLQRHTQWVHEKQMSHVCHLCGKGCRTASVLKEHLVNFHNSATKSVLFENTVMVACDLCTMTFQNVHGLNLHKTHYHDAPKNTRIPCEHCGKAFTKIELLRLHQKSHHATEDQIAKVECLCEKCNCTFTNAADLNVHLAMCLDDLKCFKCEHCAVGNWHSGIALRRHLAEVHQNVRDVCKICGLIMKAHFYLPQHMKVHGVGKLLQCPQCKKELKSLLSLNNHINTVHKKLKPNKCSDCEMAFANRHTLIYHEEKVHNKVQIPRTKNGEVQKSSLQSRLSFSCKHCQFVSNVRRIYHMHMQSQHPEEIPHKCDLCDKRFFDKSKRNNHIAVVHDKQKPYKCDACNDSFTTNSLLYRHKHTKHIRATNYKCQQCKYSTYTPGALQIHVRYVHDKVKPHICDYCSMAFTYKRDKEKHMSKLHGA
jgi:KRAB domain-containing zinc finger protein